jgi:epsilon-lactone hydrolase
MSWSTIHPLAPPDALFMSQLRSALEPNKGKLRGTAARGPFDAAMNGVTVPEGLHFFEDKVGDIPGWWCEPKNAMPGAAILHFHGGWFNVGSAAAYRNFVGHIARSAGVAAFIPEYRLAPEHPFPAAIEDAWASLGGLAELSVRRIAVTGDSAGGNLALSLLALVTASPATCLRLVGAAALSPVTDLALEGSSWQTRAQADPYFVRGQVEELVNAYLNGHDPTDPVASPLYGTFAGLPPIRVQVGDDEVLLDDSLRYVERAAAAGVDAKLDIWQGMPHVFQSGIGRMQAAAAAVGAIGDFLALRLAADSGAIGLN